MTIYEQLFCEQSLEASNNAAVTTDVEADDRRHDAFGRRRSAPGLTERLT